MVAIVIGTIAVNAMNDYTGSLSLQAAGLRIKRIYSAVGRRRPRLPVHAATSTPATSRPTSTNFLLFISYWIAPLVGVVLADWWLRRRRADVSRLRRLRRPADAASSALVALVVGFVVVDPVPELDARLRWGGPFNYVTANYLHGADIAYYVGGVVAFADLLVRGARRRSVAA